MTEAEFVTAVWRGDSNAVSTALAATPALVHAVADDGQSALILALYQGHREIVALLVEHRKNVFTIFEAAALGDAHSVATLLDFNLPLANAYAPDGFTALQLAARFGHYVCTKLLLERGAAVDAVSQNIPPITALQLAVANGDESVAEALTAALLAARANPNLAPADSPTPLMTAQQNHHGRVARLLQAKGATL